MTSQVHHALPLVVFLSRVIIGAVIGLVIGIERALKGRPAGVHTAGLVAMGAAIFTAIQPAAGATSDRVIANIVTGIGFLAGGVILREGASVSGLNTAATLWATAAVGALCGLGLFREAIIAGLAVVLINVLMDRLVAAIGPRGGQRSEPL